MSDHYREWLKALNYEKEGVGNGIRKLNEFFEWLARQEIHAISDITAAMVVQFFEHLSTRKNKRTGGGLSINYLKGYQRELRLFSRYLRETRQGHIEVSMRIKAPDPMKMKRLFFSRAEINRLYLACQDDLLGIRDRAMLSVYYGCGLRRNEGVSLELTDIQFKRAMVYVRKGKNYKERYVPMVGRVLMDLRNYVEYSRSALETESTGNQFFVGYRGGTVGRNTMCLRFKRIKADAGLSKEGGLHALRHSIATHLLAAGMSLEQIAQFLGHRSLESTQIYTHIIHE